MEVWGGGFKSYVQVIGSIWFLGCLSFRHCLMETLQTWHKYVLWVKDELIEFQKSEVKSQCPLTSVEHLKSALRETLTRWSGWYDWICQPEVKANVTSYTVYMYISFFCFCRYFGIYPLILTDFTRSSVLPGWTFLWRIYVSEFSHPCLKRCCPPQAPSDLALRHSPPFMNVLHRAVGAHRLSMYDRVKSRCLPWWDSYGPFIIYLLLLNCACGKVKLIYFPTKAFLIREREFDSIF